jgi:NDP-sugar pyrophosphorylase family protein
VSADNKGMPPIVILAGGLATRLRPLTYSIPKSMIRVAGAPFIEHQLRLLVREGFSDVVICTGHFGDQIESFVGNGSRFGCSVRYSNDGPVPLGTGGALLQAAPLLDTNFMVMYGDSYLDTSYMQTYHAFRRCGFSALMTVYRNEGRWDTSNVEFSDGMIRRYDKLRTTSAMQYIDYGLGVLNRDALSTFDHERSFDLAQLYGSLAERELLAGYEVHQRFYEIGSAAGLAETDKYLVSQGRYLLVHLLKDL